MISRDRFSQESQDYVAIVAVCRLQRLDSEPGVNTVEINVENHEGLNRECFIRIRFDHGKRCEKGSSP